MAQFASVLIDGVAVDENWISLSLRRRDEEATDVLTLELADNSLYSLFDFNTLPQVPPQIQVATANGTAKTDGVTAVLDLTSASSDFVAQGVTSNDLVKVISSPVAADIGVFKIFSVTTTVLTTEHVFSAASGVVFIVLVNQGFFFGEKPDVLEDANKVVIPSLWGRNELARLQDPFALKITRSFDDETTMQAIVKDLVEEAGMEPLNVVFDIDDYTVPGGLLRVVDQYPLQIIVDLVTRTNGYVRSDKLGNLHVKKRFFHFGAVSSVKALADDDLHGDMNEILDFPEFGNRILIRSSIPSSGQAIQVQIRPATRCLRADGFSQMEVLGVIRDDEGKAVPDGLIVDFTIDNPTLAFFLNPFVPTRQRSIVDESRRASALLSVSTDFPIVSVLGVFLETDSFKTDNFFTGGSFGGSRITLGKELPFTDSVVVIDYVAGGIAVATLKSIAGAPEIDTTIHAAVGKVRASASFCISNRRNGSIQLSARPTEHNVCIVADRTSEIEARVIVDGLPAQGTMIRWTVAGIGSISPVFSIVTNTDITLERTKPKNVFTVGTKYEIVSVSGVFLQATGRAGTNYFTLSQDRTGSFQKNEITLGTNLPSLDASLIVDYRAASIANATYTAPEQVGGATITATLNTGEERGLEQTVNISVVNRCNPLQLGGAKNPPGADKDCSKSVPSARSCANQPTEGARVECICVAEGNPGGCPEDCDQFCTEMYNKHGLDPLNCETTVTPQEISELQSAYGTLISGNDARAFKACDQECQGDPDCVAACVPGHRPATIERCAKTCEDHGISISPEEATMACNTAEPDITFTVKGGTPPYSWSSSSKSTLTVNPEGTEAVLTPPTNNSTLPDNFPAYQRQVCFQGKGHVLGVGHGNCVAQTCFSACGPNTTFPTGAINCSNLIPPANVQSIFNNFGTPSNEFCEDHLGHCQFSASANCVGVAGPGSISFIDCTFVINEDISIGSVAEARIRASGALTDLRTPTDIAAGCEPCALDLQDTTVTVRDSLGNTAIAVVDTEG